MIDTCESDASLVYSNSCTVMPPFRDTTGASGALRAASDSQRARAGLPVTFASAQAHAHRTKKVQVQMSCLQSPGSTVSCRVPWSQSSQKLAQQPATPHVARHRSPSLAAPLEQPKRPPLQSTMREWRVGHPKHECRRTGQASALNPLSFLEPSPEPQQQREMASTTQDGIPPAASTGGKHGSGAIAAHLLRLLALSIRAHRTRRGHRSRRALSVARLSNQPVGLVRDLPSCN